MIQRILVGVSDCPAALAAARLAVDLAASCGATVRFVHALVDGELDAALFVVSREARAGGMDRLTARRLDAADAVLRHVADLAGGRGVPAETVQLGGQPAECLLAEADRWPADMIVLGRGDLPAGRQPVVGAQISRVLEFARQPVLVVPPSEWTD